MSLNANTNYDVLLANTKPQPSRKAPETKAFGTQSNNQSFSNTIDEAKRRQTREDNKADSKPENPPKAANKTASSPPADGKALPRAGDEKEPVSEEEAAEQAALALLSEEQSLEINFQFEAAADIEEMSDDAVVLAAGFVFESLPKAATEKGADIELNASSSSVRPDLLNRLELSAKGELNQDGKLATEMLPIDPAVTLKAEVPVMLEKVETSAVQTQNATAKLLPQAAPAEMTVPTKVGAKDWGESVAGRISLMVNQRISSARIKLTPPELGPIEVRVNVNNDQASVQFLSHSAQVRDALEQSMPRLREMLEAAGFSLADADVSDQSRNQGGDSDENDSGQDESGTEVSETQELKAETLGLVDQYV